MKRTQAILVVCRGNIARSPFAEAIIRQELELRGLHDRIHVVSRGVQGTAVDPEPVKMPNLTYYPQIFAGVHALLAKLRVDFVAHRSTVVSSYDVRQASIIFAMDARTSEKLRQLFPRQSGKVHLFSEIAGERSDVIDPEVIDPNDQAPVFLQIRQMIVGHFPRLLAIMEAI